MEGVRNHLDTRALIKLQFTIIRLNFKKKEEKSSQFNQICPLVRQLTKKSGVYCVDCIPSTCQLGFTHPFL